jgi:ABC-type transport system involved in cytochrome c biogenesis permease subunit
LIPGRTVQPAQARGLALSLVDAGSADGTRSAERGLPAVVSLARGSDTRYAWLGYARPVTWGAVWASQRSSGPALAVKASAGGSSLPLQSLEGEAVPADSLYLRFGRNENEQAFTIPGRNLAFRVVSYESLADRGYDRPVFLVEGYEGSDPAPGLNELVESNKTVEWQGTTLTLQRDAYVVVDLAALPGLPLLMLGGLLLLAGVVMTAWGGLTRLWVNAAAERDGTSVAVRAAAPAVGQREAARIAVGLVAADETFRARSQRLKPGLAYALYTLGGAALLGAMAVLGLQSASLVTALPPVFLGHAVLALLGLGALVVAAGQSLWFAVRRNRLSGVADPELPGPAQALRGRPGDPGRAVGLAAFPLLTAALVLGSVWALFVSAAPVRPLAAEMWLFVAWLVASAYFHATSGWRPLRVPAWLAAALLMAALAAGIAACLAAPSLLTL